VAASFLGDDRHEPDYAGQVADLVDREILRLIDDAFSLAQRVLESNRAPLDAFVALLIERETVREAELAWLAGQIVGPDAPPVPFRPVQVGRR
jgi:ATP-dependent Zn protease